MEKGLNLFLHQKENFVLENVTLKQKENVRLENVFNVKKNFLPELIQIKNFVLQIVVMSIEKDMKLKFVRYVTKALLQKFHLNEYIVLINVLEKVCLTAKK